MDPTNPYRFGIFRSVSPEKVALVASLSVEDPSSLEFSKNEPKSGDEEIYDNNDANSMFEMNIPKLIRGIRQGKCYANRLHIMLFNIANHDDMNYEKNIQHIKDLIQKGINVNFPVLDENFSPLASPLVIVEETKWPAQVIKILQSNHSI